MIDFLRGGVRELVTQEALVEALSREAPEAARDKLEVLASTLSGFLLTLPDALAFMMRASKDPRIGRIVAFANGQIVHYVMDDQDLFPISEHGVLGILDDAFLVHRHVTALLSWYPWLKDAVESYQAPPAETFRLVERLLPAGLCEALQNTVQRVLTVASSLIGSSVPADPATEGGQGELRLRVEGALEETGPGR